LEKLLRKYSAPGLKRWVLFTIIGLLSIIFGFALIFKAHPIANISNLLWAVLSWIADHVPPTISGLIAVSVGSFALIYAIYRSNKHILSVFAPQEQSLFEALDREYMSSKGIKVVAIGGGTGLSNMLRGLKNFTSNITAVVTVADDGGSSGKLRESLNMVPPGDIRNCIAALAPDEELITQLFQYRFDSSAPESLKNHSFGNLFLTALMELGGMRNMADAVKQACKLLRTRGLVLPVSNQPMKLRAEMTDGSIVDGESNIPKANGRVKTLSCLEKDIVVLPEVLAAISEAELIVLGPGSLYTSIIPNLLVPKLAEAISEAKACKIYACNVMTQPGESSDYTVSDHIQAILDHVPQDIKLIDYVIANNKKPHARQLIDYSNDNQFQVEVDEAHIKRQGIKLHATNLLNKGNLVRHNPYKLSKAILKVFADCVDEGKTDFNT
jgi:uncharacterized cofD-like protein